MPIRKILVTIENRVSANYILHALLERKWEAETAFKIIHVMETPPNLDLPDSYWESRKRLRTGVEFLLNDVAKEIEGFLKTSDTQTEIREGDAKQQILYVAERWRPDLIVMGTHGHRGLNRWLIGSVAHSVTAHAPCSVLVVKQTTAHQESDLSGHHSAATDVLEISKRS